MTMVRGSNPIWFEVDLTAHAFDDTYWLFVLDNEIPYGPLPTWKDPFGNVEWTNPIRFLANGTLPNNIYFDPDVVYRLEFRQGPTQQDPLIYLVENYVPGSSGTTPIDTAAFSTDNQITNPQFSVINFASPLSLTSVSTQVINVAPGWFLNLTGTGNVALTQVLLNSAVTNPTNASYALQIQLSGSWTNAYLSQRFERNGVLWANTFVSSNIMALSGSAPQNISATLVDSQGNTLASVLAATALTEQFNAYPGIGTLPASIDTDFPPTAYIEYQLLLPDNCNITLSSVQLISSDVAVEFPYEQTTIERQVDQTFHNYKNSILLMPKSTILAGWNFGLNPWQFTTTSNTNLATFGYTADQTIAIQQNYVSTATGNNISIAQGTPAQNQGFKVTAVTATNQFALIQYVDPQNIRQYWGYLLSSLVKVISSRQSSSVPFRLKMRLIYRTTLPPLLSQTEPIASWTAGSDPLFASGWTAVAPKNDPSYALSNGTNEIAFDSMLLPASSASAMTMGIVIYSIDNLVQTSPADFVIFDDISLVPNEFAIASNVMTFDETLSRCQFHYQKSFPMGTVPANNTGVTSAALGAQIVNTGGQTGATGPIVRFPTYMSAVPNVNGTPTILLYNPSNNNDGNILNTATGNAWSSSSATEISQWGFVSQGTVPMTGSSQGNGLAVHWSASSRLGT